MTEEERTQLRMNAMQDIGNELAVPPGHMLIFNEKLMHEVCPDKPATPSHTILRLFTGWRLTTASTPQLGTVELEAALAQQAVCRLKSGQTPKLYANMSWSQPGQRRAIEAWSVATFEPRCRTRRAGGQGSGCARGAPRPG